MSPAREKESEIIVRACKYDGTEHRRWSARLISRDDSLLQLDARFEEEIRHALLGTIARGTLSREYYWLYRWYNVFRFHEPTGELRNYYCNINVPPVLEGRVLSYVDLDIDILVAPDLSFRIVDEDEFEANAAHYDYPADVRLKAREALAELVSMIESRSFPFDYRARSRW
jgi:protein associated with RNAse G/E